MTTLREAAEAALAAMTWPLFSSSWEAKHNAAIDALRAAKREWQGLTHEERAEICKDFVGDDGRVGAYLSLALEVEVRLTEKNKEKNG